MSNNTEYRCVQKGTPKKRINRHMQNSTVIVRVFIFVSIRLFDGHQSDYLKNLIYKFSCMFSV